MATYISLLRGINVSGKNIIKMEALQKLYENLGFDNITTYIQSGNVVFTSTAISPEKLTEKISTQIKKDFNFDVPVTIVTIDNLQKIIENNPFLKDSSKEENFLHITFLSSKPEKYDSKIIEEKKSIGEEFVIVEQAVYLYCPNGYGNTKLHNTFLETKLKVGATTRNLKTANKLLQIAKET
jgi:uncharacterized protein (DUF1697 family)